MSLKSWLGMGRDRPEPDESMYDRLGRLESDMRQMKLDFEQLYDSVHHMLAKIGKRVQRQAVEQETIVPANGNGPIQASEYGTLLQMARNRYR